MNNSINPIIARRRSQRNFSKEPIDLAVLHRLVLAAQGKTSDAGHRSAPSANALHPLRLFIAVGSVTGLAGGLYAVDAETSEFQIKHQRDIRPTLEDSAIGKQTWIGNAAAIITICADFIAPCEEFSNQPPYGRRGERYVYIEAGAAAQNIQLQATCDDIASVVVAGFNDESTALALGLSAPLAPVLHVCLGCISDTKCDD